MRLFFYLTILLLVGLVASIIGKPFAILADGPVVQDAPQRWQALTAESLKRPAPPSLTTPASTSFRPNLLEIVPHTMLVWQHGSESQWDLNYAMPDGIELPLVRTTDLSETRPNVRSGSTTVVYSAYSSEDQAELYTVSPEQPTPVRLTNVQGIDTFPLWSRDGTYIYFVSTRDGNAEIYRTRSDGSETMRLTNSPNADLYPALTQDGGELAWIRVVSETEGDILAMDLATGATRVVKSAIRYPSVLVWRSLTPEVERADAFPYWVYTCEANGDNWFDLCWVSRDGTSQSHLIFSEEMTDLFASSSIPGDNGLLITGYHYTAPDLLSDVDIFRYGSQSVAQGDLLEPYLIGEDRFDGNAAYGKTDGFPPQIILQEPFPRFVGLWQRSNLFYFPFSATDNASGFSDVRLLRRMAGSSWTRVGAPFLESPLQAIPFTGMNMGETAEFSIVGQDQVGNIEIPTSENTYPVTIIHQHINNRTVDTRGIPLPDATLEGSHILTQTTRTSDGISDAYLVATDTLRFVAPGYQSSVNTSSTVILSDRYNPSDFVPYAFLSSTPLNPNPGFELGLEGYTGTNMSLTNTPGYVGTGHSAVGIGIRGSLSFSVSLPNTIHAPTLSFLYQTPTFDSDGFGVEIANELTSTMFYYNDNVISNTYQHQWIDLAPWIGDEITVTFGPGYSGALSLDEVTVASWNTPVITTISPTFVSIPYNNTGVIVTGQNLIPPLTATVNNVTVPVTSVDSQTAQVSIPNGLGAGRYTLTIRNNAGLTARTTLQIGTPAYLPLVSRP